MFKQLQNIDTAFRHIRLFSLLFLLANCIEGVYTQYRYSKAISANQNHVFVIANGKLMEALAVDRAEKLPLEIRDHVKTFHSYFFSLEPDDKIIKDHITRALYLADQSAKNEYDNLNENSYYANIISGNISQKVEEPDSIYVNIDQQPYYFKYYTKLKIIRTTTITTRSLITEGYIRLTGSSDNNIHGFMIEGWKILANQDISSEKR